MSTCNLHVCHNPSRKGLQVFGENLSEHAIYGIVFYLQTLDYEEVQGKLGLSAEKRLTHVESR